MRWRLWVLLGLLLAAAIAVLFFRPIPQNEAYHNFADRRLLLGIPNCFNVISNIFFLVAGVTGSRCVLRGMAEGGPSFVDPLERWPYFVFFLAIALTAFGSSYYHLHPDDSRLVWDRIAITLAFMSLVAAIVAERIDVKTGLWLLAPLLLLGAGSVIYWGVTQAVGHGDLRPYVFVQFGSMLALLLLLILYAPRYTYTAGFVVSFGLYVFAKLVEAADRVVFSWGGIVSGHALKHIFAGLSAYWILRMLKFRAPVPLPRN